jgi:hypothetical protein
MQKDNRKSLLTSIYFSVYVLESLISYSIQQQEFERKKKNFFE